MAIEKMKKLRLMAIRSQKEALMRDMGFKALGLEACPAAGVDEAREILRRLTKDSEEYAIIYIEENLASELQSEINKYKDSPTPAIILIPGREGSTGMKLEENENSTKVRLLKVKEMVLQKAHHYK